jgi:DNA-binding GntR family transcriptional regulator
VAVDARVREPFAELLSAFEAIGREQPSPQRRERFYELAEAYDQAVIANARNEHLSRLVADLRPHSARLRIIAHSKPDRLEVSLGEHLAMCRAIVDHDPDAAAAACTKHLMNTERTILDAVLDPAGSSVPVDIVSA